MLDGAHKAQASQGAEAWREAKVVKSNFYRGQLTSWWALQISNEWIAIWKHASVLGGCAMQRE